MNIPATFLRHVYNTLPGRWVLLALLINILLPPVLYHRLDTLLRHNASASFIRQAHVYASALAHELEAVDFLQSPARVVAFLDAIVKDGGPLYAAIDYRGNLLGSSLGKPPDGVRQRRSDTTLAEAGHDPFAQSVPFVRAGVQGWLYLGFDPSTTSEQLQQARRQLMLALVVYATVSIVMLLLLSRNLEAMRSEQVHTAAQLRGEIAECEKERRLRQELEQRIRHEQRLATIGTLAGGLAHEINNTILPMLLYSEQALDDIAPEHPARRDVEQILVAALRASAVISKVLAFSRAPEKHGLETFDPAIVLTEAVRLFGALMPANIELKTDVRSQGRCMLGDPTLLNQVVLNLVTNAMQALHEAGGSLWITLDSADRVTTEGTGAQLTQVVELRVKDSGSGIAPEALGRIFEPFFTTRAVGEGTGLGLSVVHGIVTGMGGSISVHSAIGKGTEFTVVLPTTGEVALVC